MPFAIKDLESGKFAMHTGTASSYPWKMVSRIEEATVYKTFEHANEIAFWNLDSSKDWAMVSTVTGKAYQKDMPKYWPV